MKVESNKVLPSAIYQDVWIDLTDIPWPYVDDQSRPLDENRPLRERHGHVWRYPPGSPTEEKMVVL